MDSEKAQHQLCNACGALLLATPSVHRGKGLSWLAKELKLRASMNSVVQSWEEPTAGRQKPEHSGGGSTFKKHPQCDYKIASLVF